MTTQPQPAPPEAPAWAVKAARELLDLGLSFYDPAPIYEKRLTTASKIIARHAREACPPPAKNSDYDMTTAEIAAAIDAEFVVEYRAGGNYAPPEQVEKFLQHEFSRKSVKRNLQPERNTQVVLNGPQPLESGKPI